MNGLAAEGPVPPSRPAADILASSPVFAGIQQDEIRGLLADIGEELQVAPGTDLVTEGGTPDAFFFLLEGEAEVLRRTDDGRTLALTRLAAVQALGEFALFDPAPRSATLRAVGPCRLIRVPC